MLSFSLVIGKLFTGHNAASGHCLLTSSQRPCRTGRRLSPAPCRPGLVLHARVPPSGHLPTRTDIYFYTFSHASDRILNTQVTNSELYKHYSFRLNNVPRETTSPLPPHLLRPGISTPHPPRDVRLVLSPRAPHAHELVKGTLQRQGAESGAGAPPRTSSSPSGPASVCPPQPTTAEAPRRDRLPPAPFSPLAPRGQNTALK